MPIAEPQVIRWQDEDLWSDSARASMSLGHDGGKTDATPPGAGQGPFQASGEFFSRDGALLSGALDGAEPLGPTLGDANSVENKPR